MTVYVIVQLKTGIHFCGIRAADSPEYLEISKDRKAGAQGIVLLAKGFDRHHDGPNPKPRKNGTGV